MNLLKRDIEEIKSRHLDKPIEIIFQIKSWEKAKLILFKLKEIGYCENYEAWMNSRSAEKSFNSQSSDYIKLGTYSKNVVYSSGSNFHEKKKESGIVALETILYIDKMPKKKLNL